MVWRDLRTFNFTSACLKCHYFRNALHCCPTLYKPMNSRYCPERQFSLEFLSKFCRWSRQFPINPKRKVTLLPIFWCQGQCVFGPHAKTFFQFAITISLEKNDSHRVLEFFIFIFFNCAHNFLMPPLQCNESIDCRMKIVLNVTKGFTYFFLYLSSFQITILSLLFSKTVINSWELSHPSKSYKPMKAADIFSKVRPTKKYEFGEKMVFIKTCLYGKETTKWLLFFSWFYSPKDIFYTKVASSLLLKKCCIKLV